LLRRVCSGRRGALSSKSIGGWLKKIKGRVVSERRLTIAVNPIHRKHGARYELEAAPFGRKR
jgi:hypothetical protein